MAISYQGRQYREDGAPLDASGNVVMGGSWINPNYAFAGGILSDSSGARFDLGSIGQDGGMQIRPDVQVGRVPPPAMPAPMPLQTMPLNLGPAPAAPTPWGGVPQQQLQPAPQAPQSPQGGPQGGGGNPYLSNNPHLGPMADEIGRRSRLDRDSAFNDIRSNAIGINGLGGSRMGVAQGLATARSNDALTGNLANLFGGQYNMDANRELSRYGADQNFYTAQRGQDFVGADLGMRLATQAAENQWLAPRNAANIYGNFSGIGNTTNTQNSGGGWMGAAGGALGAAQLGQNLGWWGGTQNNNTQRGW